MSDPIVVTTGYGVTVTHGGTELAGVRAVTPPTMETAEIDTTHMKSPNRVKESLPGFITPGEMSVTLHHAPIQTAALRDLQFARTVEAWVVVFGDNGGTFNSQGYIKTVGQPVEMEGLTTVEVTVKLTGAPVFTP